jgi:hypothetical protein
MLKNYDPALIITDDCNRKSEVIMKMSVLQGDPGYTFRTGRESRGCFCLYDNVAIN